MFYCLICVAVFLTLFFLTILSSFPHSNVKLVYNLVLPFSCHFASYYSVQLPGIFLLFTLVSFFCRTVSNDVSYIPSVSRTHRFVLIKVVQFGSVRNASDLYSRHSRSQSTQWHWQPWQICVVFNPLNAELNPICYLLALLGAHHFLHVSRIRVKSLTIRLLMSYIYIYIYIYIWSTHSWCF